MWCGWVKLGLGGGDIRLKQICKVNSQNNALLQPLSVCYIEVSAKSTPSSLLKAMYCITL